MMGAFATALVSVAAVACTFSSAHAAPATFPVSGAAMNACSFSAAGVGLTVVNTNNVMTITFAPSSMTAWCNSAGTLSVSSTRLLKSGTTNKFSDYSLSVSGWGSAMSYTTAATLPAPTTQTSTTRSTSLTFTCTSGCTAPPVPKNTSWGATITLALSPN